MSHTYTQLLYHIVFATKDRRPWLAAEIRPRVHQYLGGAIRAEGGIAIIVGGVEDHLHILAQLRQDQSVADVLRNLKANSSGWIRETLAGMQDFAWQRGYSAFTVSHSQKERVRRYIEGQEEHHRRQTFQEELRALLERHSVEFDEKYLVE